MNALSPLAQASWLHQHGQLDAAAESCVSILAAQPRDFDATHLLGLVRAQQGRLDDAARCFEKAAALRPRSAEAQRNLGAVLDALHRHDAAIARFRKALELAGNDAELQYSLGNAYANAGRHEPAIASFRKALAQRPDFAQAHNNLGVALRASGQTEAAAASFAAAAALMPESAHAHFNLGNALMSLERIDEAVTSYERAIALEPAHLRGHVNLGLAHAATGRHEAALPCFERALALRPDYADAHRHLGNALAALGRHDAAIASYDRALTLRPDHAEAHYDRATALVAAKRLDLALEAFRQAIALRPDDADAYHDLGNALQMADRYDAAIASYQQVLALRPDDANALAMLALAKRHICDWNESREIEDRLFEAVRAGAAGIAPFPLLAMTDDPELQLLCARQFRGAAAVPQAFPRRAPTPRPRLRLGYLSGDFHEHATAYLMAELFERHDRGRFEVFAFSYGPDDRSPMRERLIKAFDGFFDLGEVSDEAIARAIRDREIDILVDLKGRTTDTRFDLLALRPAPVQAHYIGYPGTLGAPFIDYAIVDPFIAPMDAQPFFTERLVHLPDCYQVNDRKRPIGEAPSRAQCGLPEAGLVFCCFNNSYKITPDIFAVWMRLLAAVPGSVLWLLGDNRWAEDNLRGEAALRGIDPGRLVFAPRQPLAQHLARHRLADLFLDTFPYTAHTTASDALWTGLPLVTCAGRSFASRVAGSLLHAAGLPELVTRDLAGYEALALALAQSPARLQAIRCKLEETRLAGPLFDSERTRRHIEAAYLRMWDIHCRGEAPRSFGVAAADEAE